MVLLILHYFYGISKHIYVKIYNIYIHMDFRGMDVCLFEYFGSIEFGNPIVLARKRWSSPIDFSALVLRIQDSHQGANRI